MEDHFIFSFFLLRKFPQHLIEIVETLTQKAQIVICRCSETPDNILSLFPYEFVRPVILYITVKRSIHIWNNLKLSSNGLLLKIRICLQVITFQLRFITYYQDMELATFNKEIDEPQQDVHRYKGTLYIIKDDETSTFHIFRI